MMLSLSQRVSIPDNEILIQGTTSQGSGGQNVNRVASAVHLFFNIHTSSLPESYKQRLLHFPHHTITESGMVVIKAQEHRAQARNREAALERLKDLILQANAPRRKRKTTHPTKGSRERRLRQKKQQGEKKQLRSNPRMHAPPS